MPLPSQAAATAPVGFSPSDGYRLVKDWDFARDLRDRDALLREFATRYIYANGALDHLNDEWSRYGDRGNHVFTARGLSLVARATGTLGPGAIESGMLRSRWSGEYGVFEIRMKVPAGRGLWPAFWLNPQDQKWPPEIDVVEIVNNGRDDTRRSFHFLHPDAAPDARARLDRDQTFAPGVDYAGGFHVFTVEWTPERVRHLVDGKLIADRAYRWAHDDGSDGGPAHVLVNLAVGGKWPGPPQRAADFPAALEIEYIRVWQRPGEVQRQ
jgi:beta-glucanase (GH16 family)